MAKEKSRVIAKSKKVSTKSATPPRSLALAEAGINTGPQFASTMSALMTDLLTGAITPEIGNAVCNAGGKLLKVVEMQHKYGKANGAQLRLAP